MFMDIQDTRRNQLRKWLSANPTPAKEKSYFSQLVNGGASFGERAARRIERDYSMGDGYLDRTETMHQQAALKHTDAPTEEPITTAKPGYIALTDDQQSVSITVGEKTRFDANVDAVALGHRQVPVISYVQAGLMTEAIDPYALGQGFEKIMTDVDVSESAFGLVIKGKSMLPDFAEGDRVVVDPMVQPLPGDFVVAKNGEEEATFKKYRPRGTNDRGEMVFELVPLNDDFPTLNSERDHMRIIATMVEHRRYRRR